MFYSKLTRKEKEDKLIKTKKLKNSIEFGNNPESKKMIIAWKEFMKLPYAEQARRRQEWEKYYQEVKHTPIYALFQAQREADARKDSGEVIALAKQAKEMRKNGDHITLLKPKFVDPWEFSQGWVKAYEDCIKAIDELNADLNMPDIEEANSVWNQ